MRLPSSDTLTDMTFSRSQCFSFQNKSWTYRGEGNANLVLALPDEGTIVRLGKYPPNKVHDNSKIFREAEFSREIMSLLLGEKFVFVPKIVRIPGWQLDQLRDQLRSIRPVYRHHKSVFGKYAAVFPDLCFLPMNRNPGVPTFCIEVKPKQGWIPHTDRRLPKCIFCINQYLKMKNGSVSKISKYCPLDLFSGDEYRMESAIKALIQSPQNNFKIFYNGHLEYGDSKGTIPTVLENLLNSYDERLTDNLSYIILQALTKQFDDTILNLNTDINEKYSQLSVQNRIPLPLLDKARSLLNDSSCIWTPSHLPNGCILAKILRIQQLDELGSDEVYRLYSASKHNDYDYVADLINNRISIFNPIYAYLLATTAKDCSILISFQPASDFECDNVIEDLNGKKFVFNIGVSDLDPKPMSCIEKHKKRDIEVVQSCISYLESHKLSS